MQTQRFYGYFTTEDRRGRFVFTLCPEENRPAHGVPMGRTKPFSPCITLTPSGEN